MFAFIFIHISFPSPCLTEWCGSPVCKEKLHLFVTALAVKLTFEKPPHNTLSRRHQNNGIRNNALFLMEMKHNLHLDQYQKWWSPLLCNHKLNELGISFIKKTGWFLLKVCLIKTIETHPTPALFWGRKNLVYIYIIYLVYFDECVVHAVYMLFSIEIIKHLIYAPGVPSIFKTFTLNLFFKYFFFSLSVNVEAAENKNPPYAVLLSIQVLKLWREREIQSSVTC